MKIAAVIIINEKTGNLERCLKSVFGWTNEIILVTASLGKVNKAVAKKYLVKQILLEPVEDKRSARGIKASGADWVIVLNSNEEVSIPLKIEMRRRLSVIIHDRVRVKLVSDDKDFWTESGVEVRIFKRYAWHRGEEFAEFDNPVRQFTPAIFLKKAAVRKDEVKRILVVKLRGIGDTILMTPLLSNLKRYYKKASITCIVKPESKNILINNPNVDNIITFLKYCNACVQILRSGKFDLVLCPQASLRSAMLALFSKARFRVVNNHNGKNYFSTFKVSKPEEYENAIERDLDCLRALGVPVKTKEVELHLLKNEHLDIRKMGFSAQDKIIGISVSASRENKMWFKERFAELADKLIKERNFKVIFIEDPAQPDTLKNVVKLMKNKPFTVCEKDLRRVLALLSGFDLFIGNDSGLLHSAVALGVPSISIVGPEEPKIFNPYTHKKDLHYTLSADLDCKPCWKKECALPLCLDAISVNQVFQTALKALK